ncbi:MAG: hypothetical protein RR370_01800 [Synergistaceae bacterium]
MSFIYTCDEEMKEKLISEGHQLLHTKPIYNNSEIIFVFASKTSSELNYIDKSKVIITNTLTF